MKKAIYILLMAFLALPFASKAVPTPTPTPDFTAIPTSVVPNYYAPAASSANPISSCERDSWYVYDATQPDAAGVTMGRQGLHIVNPMPGSLKVPFNAWVRNVVQGQTEVAFTEAVTPLPTPVAGFAFGTGGDDRDWLQEVQGVCGVTGFTDLSSESANDLADMGVNWWHYIGIGEYTMTEINPENLPVAFTVTHGNLLTGRVMFSVQWTVPPTAPRHSTP